MRPIGVQQNPGSGVELPNPGFTFAPKVRVLPLIGPFGDPQ
jgi:hypothetical protein